jgi:hypothetical protein
VTDIARVNRTPYIAILATTTGLLSWLWRSASRSVLATSSSSVLPGPETTQDTNRTGP